VLQLQVTANVVPSALILFTLMMEVIRSPETSVLIRAVWRHIPEDGILLSHPRENLKSCIFFIVFLYNVLLLLVTANVPSSLILFAIMMEAVRSSETSVLTRATRRHIPEGGILHSHRREDLKCYLTLTG
jgi:hypothetical protein